MVTVKIIKGTYGWRPNGSKHSTSVNMGETCEVSKEEAERLKDLGVAEYVTAEPVATNHVPREDKGQCDNIPDKENASQEDGEAKGHLDPEQLKTLKMDELRNLADEMGIDTHSLNTKAKLIEAICSEPVTPGEITGENPPEIGAGAPV